MNLGALCVLVAFLAALVAAAAYIADGLQQEPVRKKQVVPAKRRFSERAYYAMVIAGVVASIDLLWLLLTHRFDYTYVSQYSDRSLSVLYLISAFWAGQEGTFLFWALLTGVMGIVFLRSTRNDDRYAMAVVSLFSAFLYLLMLVKSPFEQGASMPPDGRGLNDLLQDPWMAIHPPILFAGYAATVFPFALVVSGLVRKNYGRWFRWGFPWTLFAAATLGAGIIIGGFWAYEVLGWGGYWGWDPVENSSLVPWLALLALVHGLVVQKAKNSLVRTNMFLALISFILVMYATFLTRSGILADFSVHSFVNLGINNYLVAAMIVSVLMGLGLFAVRFRQITGPGIDASNLNRELALLLSILVIAIGALLTFVGMSSPILTGLVGRASQVDTSFYNRVNLPVGIAIGLLLGITPFLGWKEDSIAGFMKRLSLPLGLTALSCVIAWVAGVTAPLTMLFVGASAFGLISNAVNAFRQYRSGLLTLGGPVAHIGVGLLLLGIIGSGSFDESTKLILKPGEPQSAYGYEFTFQGVEDNGGPKPSILINVADGKTSSVLRPKLYYSDYSQAMLREPAIRILPLKDLYISPIELRSTTAAQQHNPLYELSKGETKEIGGYKISFVRFDVGQHGSPGAMSVGAVLNVEVDGTVHEVVPRLTFEGDGTRKMIAADLPLVRGSSMGATISPQVALNSLSVEEKKVYLELVGFGEHMGPAPAEELLVDISTKPLMMVVWSGVVLILVGTVVAWWRRLKGAEAAG